MPIYEDITQQGFQFPEELITSYDDKGKITLKWEVPLVDESQLNNLYVGASDQFEIQRSDKPNFENPVNIGSVLYEKNKTNYEYINDAVDENLNLTELFTIACAGHNPANGTGAMYVNPAYL